MPGRSLLTVFDDDLAKPCVLPAVEALLTLADVFPALTPEEFDDDDGPCIGLLKRRSFLAVSCCRTPRTNDTGLRYNNNNNNNANVYGAIAEPLREFIWFIL